eukprot:07885.XXX_317377_318285_1 [CDS] Oithona nana genome sequencing.
MPNEATTLLSESPNKRNKRKSNDPVRIHQIKPDKMPKLEQTSDGEDPSPSPRLSSTSSLSPKSECRSPSPFSMAPKKRFKLDALKDLEAQKVFRPWSDEQPASQKSPKIFPYHPYMLFLYQNQQSAVASAVDPEPEQQEPLALVKPKQIKTELKQELPEKPNLSSQKVEKKANNTSSKQRNYKNMTRERRIEANARERQRVQTITEQFETLRNVIPVDDKSAKMSKLSIIKIATSYITLLSRQMGYDYTSDKSEPSIEECYSNLTNLIKYEAKMSSAANVTSTVGELPELAHKPPSASQLKM